GIDGNLIYLKTVEKSFLELKPNQISSEIKILHELAFPSVEFDTYYIDSLKDINLQDNNKAKAILLGGDTKEKNQTIIEYIEKLEIGEVIYKTFEDYI